VDVHDEIYIVSSSGAKLFRLDSPILTVLGIETTSDPDRIFILESTFHSTPALWIASNTPVSNTTSPIQLPLFSKSKSPFKTRQVFYPSTDKTMIPMFLTSSSIHQQTTQTPALLYVYGAFGISVIPHFRPDFLAFLSSFRGILAIANIRGGGEKGINWQRAARKGKRQTLFDDISSAVRYLKEDMGIRNVVLMGESMGALNVTSVMVQQPSLVQAVICSVGPFDILRRQRLSGQDRGEDEVGSPDVAEDFDSMIKWSPLENLQKGENYPPMLLMAGAEDDIVSPFHSAKMAAVMQWATAGGDVSLRVVEGAGHGGNNSQLVKAKMTIERWAWLSKVLGWEFFTQN
jgi:prolyl oligopeptidase